MNQTNAHDQSAAAHAAVSSLSATHGLSSRHAAESSDSYEASGSEVWSRVLAVVRETVHNDSVTLSDNFFDVGGHSLLGTQFVMRARKVFGVKVTLRDVFEAESVGQLAERIETLILAEVDSLSEAEAIRLVTGHAA